MRTSSDARGLHALRAAAHRTHFGVVQPLFAGVRARKQRAYLRHDKPTLRAVPPLPASAAQGA